MWKKNPLKTTNLFEIKKLRNQEYGPRYSLTQKNEHNQHVYCRGPIAAHYYTKNKWKNWDNKKKINVIISTNWTVMDLKYSFMYSSTHIICVLKLTIFIRSMKYKFAW